MRPGAYLKFLRTQKGYTIRQVVIKSNGEVDKTTISRVEREQRKISLKTAYALSKIYGVNLTEMAENLLGRPVVSRDTSFLTSADERRMIDRFRGLPPVLRMSVKNLLNAVSEDGKDVYRQEGKGADRVISGAEQGFGRGELGAEGEIVIRDS